MNKKFNEKSRNLILKKLSNLVLKKSCDLILKKPSNLMVKGFLCGVCIFATPAFAMQNKNSNATLANKQTLTGITDRVIVKYKNTSQFSSPTANANNTVNLMSQRMGLQVQYLRTTASGAQVMRFEQKQTQAQLEETISELMSDPNVEYAEPDLMMRPMSTPNDPRYSEQWHYYEPTGGLNLPTAWDTTQGQGAVVAVIDTGYRPHADLSANILPGYDMISDTTVSQDGDGRDSNAIDNGDWSLAGECDSRDPDRESSWHGTHVAGTIAALSDNSIGVAGVAYKAKIVPVRALGRCGGFTSDIADGMIWAAGGTVSGIPTNPNPAKVLNLSLGGGGACSTTQQNAINTARSLGATIVVAAGNESANASNSSPANCTGVVTVAATGRSGGRASYSNFGSIVDVAGPGGDRGALILSTYNSGQRSPGNDSYDFLAGTSMATPHVAGVAALLYSLKPTITPDEVEDILKKTARAFPATCSGCGAGIVDAAKAIAALSVVVPPPSTELVVKNISSSRSQWKRYTYVVPSGVTKLTVNISGGTGDADLYVRLGTAPTTSTYQCRPYLNGNAETCTINNPTAGTWHFGLYGYSAFSGVTLKASY
jgi:serine protease